MEGIFVTREYHLYSVYNVIGVILHRDEMAERETLVSGLGNDL